MNETLRVREIAIETDLGLHFKYKIKQEGLKVKVLADTNEIKEIFTLDRLDIVSDSLEDYLPRSIFKALMKYRCNFYISKGGCYIDIKYHSNICTPSNDFYRVVVNGASEDIYRKDDPDLNYSVLKFMWKYN